MGSPVFVLSPFLFPRKYFSLCELKEDLNSHPPCFFRKGNIGGSAGGEWLRKGGGAENTKEEEREPLVSCEYKRRHLVDEMTPFIE